MAGSQANSPDPTVTVSPEQARRLIERQFPELAPARPRPLGGGKDNTAFLCANSVVFRFQRRASTACLVAREARILPPIAPELPLPVPLPTFLGEPDEEYPFPFLGHPFLLGETGCSLGWTEELRVRTAVPLARFLGALHRIPIRNETRRWPPPTTSTGLTCHDAAPSSSAISISSGRNARDLARILELARELAATPSHSGATCWIHGDLYARHLLVNGAAALLGVIGATSTSATPALDLSIAISFLPPATRERFRTHYGPVDDETWRRARFRALYFGAVLLYDGTTHADDRRRAHG